MRFFFIIIVLLPVALSFFTSKRLKTGQDLRVPGDGLPFVIVAVSLLFPDKPDGKLADS